MTAPLVKTSTPGIYRRGSRYVVVVRDNDGSQRKRAVATLADARALKAELAIEVANGELTARSRMTFAEYAEEWLQSFTGRTSSGIRTHTMGNYERTIRGKAIPFFGDRPLGELRLTDIKRYAAHVAESGAAQNTVRLAVGPVRVMLATAVEDGILRHNPATGFRNTYGRKRTHDDKRLALTDEQLGKLVGEIPNVYRLLVTTLAQTGMRIGEAIELRWRDIDLDAGTISISRRFYRDNVDEPKSRYGIRTIPIAPELIERLRDRRTRALDDEQLVFPAPTGGNLDVKNFRARVYKPAAERAGVPWANVHMLRHTCASRLFRHGWTAKHVQLMLGHHSPAFTLTTYVHLIPGDLAALPLPGPVDRIELESTSPTCAS